MKATKLMALGTWMVEHLTFGLTNEALSGDLLEQFQSGRSAGWYWCQVGSAIATGLWSRSRDFALPLIYCPAWTSLYPGWKFLCNAVLVRVMQDGWTGLAWPWSALLLLGYGVVPALTFVWLGFLAYELARPGIFHQLTARRLVWGVSASLDVLLVLTLLLLWHFRQPRVRLDSMMRTDFYSAFHLLSISVPLALSLLAALVFTNSRAHRLTWR